MKQFTYLIFSAFLAAPAAFGQAKSDVVGYISLGNTTSGIAVPANTDITFSIPFAKKTEHIGKVVSATPTNITLASGTIPSGIDFSSGAAYIATVVNGTEEGASALILSNSGDLLTIVPTNSGNFSTLTSTDTVEISQAWTLSNAFDQALPAGTQLFAFDSSSQNINESATQTYVTNGSNGWFQIGGGTGPADNIILYPGESFVIRSSTSPIPDLTISGMVPDYNSRVTIAKTATGGQDIRIAYNSPVSEKVLDSGLGQNPGDQLLIFDQNAAQQNKSAAITLVWSGSTWFGIGGITGVQNDYELEAGQGYVYRFAAPSPSSAYDWNQEQSYQSNL